MSSLGFTTGCLKRQFSLFETLEIYSRNQIHDVEISFATYEELMECELQGLGEAAGRFQGVSIHAPYIRFQYAPSDETKNVLQRLAAINGIVKPLTFVFHPDTITDFSLLVKVGFPVALENMDSQKASGTRPEEFESYKTMLDCKFVLDIQHAFEHDPGMGLANELYDCMKDRLSHFHISGQNEQSIHTLLQHAANRGPVLEFYRAHPGVRTIEEGVIGRDYYAEIEREMILLQKSTEI